jgi:hypothetical protein
MSESQIVLGIEVQDSPNNNVPLATLLNTTTTTTTISSPIPVVDNDGGGSNDTGAPSVTIMTSTQTISPMGGDVIISVNPLPAVNYVLKAAPDYSVGLVPSYAWYQAGENLNNGEEQMFVAHMDCFLCCGTVINIYKDDTRPRIGKIIGNIRDIQYKCLDNQDNVLGSIEFLWCPGPLCCCRGFPFEFYIGNGPNRRHLHGEASIDCLEPLKFQVTNEQGEVEMKIVKLAPTRGKHLITVQPADRVMPSLAFFVAIAVDLHYTVYRSNRRMW